jgi:hypothetical protein
MQPSGPMHCTRALGGGMDCYPIDPDRAEAMGMFCGLLVAIFLALALVAFLVDRYKKWRLASFTRQHAASAPYDASPNHRFSEGDRVVQPPPPPSATPGAGMRDVRLHESSGRRGEVLGAGGVEGGRVASLVRWDDGLTEEVDEASIVHEAMYRGE